MAKSAAKVAISVPQDLFRALERARKKNGKSRSAVVQDALRHWLNQQREAEMVRQYVEGYRKKPETRREMDEAEALAIRAFATEEW